MDDESMTPESAILSIEAKMMDLSDSDRHRAAGAIRTLKGVFGAKPSGTS